MAKIYIHVEVAARELDAALLLSVLAAERGHEIVVSDLDTIMDGFRRDLIRPGIFHTKSVTPSRAKHERHRMLKDAGFLVTSQDQEGGIIEDDFERFARERFSSKSFELADLVFCWGDRDFEFLRSEYPQYEEKIVKVGSPRVDLLDHRFISQINSKSWAPDRPFVLFSSNFGLISGEKPFSKIVEISRTSGYFERGNYENRMFRIAAHELRIVEEFIRAVRALSSSSSNFDIVVRPHPTERLEAWNEYLGNLPNVHVVREGSSIPWIHGAFAVVHNGCTSALEASIIGTAVITFKPQGLEFESSIPNALGKTVESVDSLVEALGHLGGNPAETPIDFAQNSIPDSLKPLLYVCGDRLASERILDSWEQFPLPTTERNNYAKLQLLGLLRDWRRNLLGARANFMGRRTSLSPNAKFDALDLQEVRARLHELGDALELKKKIRVRKLSSRGIAITTKS